MKILSLFIIILTASTSFANAPKVGRSAAAKYFQARGGASDKVSDSDYTPSRSSDTNQPRTPTSVVEALGADEHYLAIGMGSYSSSDAYKWGENGKEENVGKWGIDMTYRLTQDFELFDEAVRLSYNKFEVQGETASKLSFLYALTFPDAGSKFPLYFGIAAGPGIFFNQIKNGGKESDLSLDYQLFAGLRIFNLFENTGFYVEGGLRNHLHLTSDGQLNGTFISAGAVFTF